MAQNPKEENRTPINQVGLDLLREHMAPYAAKLQSQGILPQGVIIDIREAPEKSNLYIHPEFRYFKDQRRISKGDAFIIYPPLPGDLLTYLSEHPNKVLSHVEIGQAVWGYSNCDNKIIRSQILEVRRGMREIGVDNPLEVLVKHHRWGYELRDPSLMLAQELITDKSQEKEKVFTHPYFTFYPERNMLKVEGEVVSLTNLEKLILERLVRSVNRGVAYDFFMDDFDDPDLSLLKTHVSHIRKKIEQGRDLEDPLIQSVVGAGYILYDFSKMTEAEKVAVVRNIRPQKQ